MTKLKKKNKTNKQKKKQKQNKTKTVKCFQGPTFTLTVCSAHLNDLKM